MQREAMTHVKDVLRNGVVLPDEYRIYAPFLVRIAKKYSIEFSADIWQEMITELWMIQKNGNMNASGILDRSQKRRVSKAAYRAFRSCKGKREVPIGAWIDNRSQSLFNAYRHKTHVSMRDAYKRVEPSTKLAKQKRYARNMSLESRCPHCGKPCYPFKSCEEYRRKKRDSMAALNRRRREQNAEPTV